MVCDSNVDPNGEIILFYTYTAVFQNAINTFVLETSLKLHLFLPKLCLVLCLVYLLINMVYI